MQKVLFYLKKYGRDIIIVFLLLVCITLIIWKFYFDDEVNVSSNNEVAFNEKQIEEKVEEDTATRTDAHVNVDIKGAVKKPGVYRVSDKAIINDIITLAGGFNAGAYKDGINMSKKVSDEMVIYVYTKAEIAKANKNTANEEVCKAPSYTIVECVDDKKSVIVSENDTNSEIINKEQDKDTNNTLVNINTASINELLTLSGIGESKAKAIVAYRTDKGLFKAISDIMNVSGIGESVFAKIKSFITI